jgi:hypothetical protein
LVDAQLLEVVGEDDFGQVRYRFHDLLRVFAQERLREEESVSARRAALKRVLDAKLARARVADLVLQSGHVAPDRPALADADLGEQVRHDSLGWFSSEHAGLVAFVSQAYEAEFFESTQELAIVLAYFFGLYCHGCG